MALRYSPFPWGDCFAKDNFPCDNISNPTSVTFMSHYGTPNNKSLFQTPYVMVRIFRVCVFKKLKGIQGFCVALRPITIVVPNGNAKKSKFIIAFFLPVKLWFEILTFYAILGSESNICARKSSVWCRFKLSSNCSRLLFKTAFIRQFVRLCSNFYRRILI